ncbi:hypothetical protein [Paenirhodobacter ferrireducens]|uniref:hypothetical protein n=1 Tax=Paenirhodobacter ferrireducens TaxID=1215032 RepID=UPI0013E297A7|nr:hypothetical protein [Sinirhodobacter ferrireducens]
MTVADIWRFIRNTRLSGVRSDENPWSVAERDAADEPRMPPRCPAAGLCRFAA